MNSWHESFELLKSIEDSSALDKSVLKWLRKFGEGLISKLGLSSEKNVVKRAIGDTAASRSQDAAKRAIGEVGNKTKLKVHQGGTPPKKGVTDIPTQHMETHVKRDARMSGEQLPIGREALEPITPAQIATDKVVSLPRVKIQRQRDQIDKIKAAAKAAGQTKQSPVKLVGTSKADVKRGKLLKLIEEGTDQGLSQQQILKNPEVSTLLNAVREKYPKILPGFGAPKAKIISIKSAKDKPLTDEQLFDFARRRIGLRPATFRHGPKPSKPD